MDNQEPTIYIVDDDASVRQSTAMMLHSIGFNVQAFVSAQDFLNANIQEETLGCLILDVRMPGISGLDLQEKLASARTPLPVIFITGHGTIPMGVRAMKAGAIDFLQKPFEEQELLDAVNRAFRTQTERRARRDETYKILERLKTLTPREQEVFSLVVTGMANKEIAYKLGTSERTIKAHRAQVMEKTQARSLVDLIRFAESLKNHPPVD